ncbi:MAG: ATP-binding cassette domain-containing protein [Clostridia bacterium]|nr:ATP-binding cassette domain-containing protein [Clostridia bacterium]
MNMTINGLSKSYGKVKALSQFSYTFNNGIYALLGPNGSGKSTLMNIITGNLKADCGSVMYNGKDVLRDGKEFRETLGFMPQTPGMYPQFTVYEFMKYMSLLKGIDSKEVESIISDLLNEVELFDVSNMKIKALSGGMKQRLSLVQALAGKPELIILDEPTVGLDPRQRIIVRNLISRIAVDKTVIIATHIVSDIEAFASRVIMLKKGCIAENGTPTELAQKSNGKVWEISVPKNQLSNLNKNNNIISINNGEESSVVRILSHNCPQENARSVAATLEDRYFEIFGEI